MSTLNWGFFSIFPGESELANFGTGQEPHRAEIADSRQRLENLLGRQTFWMNQVHGADAQVWQNRAGQMGADIAFVSFDTARSGLAPAACVVTADCVPILMADEDGSCWAAVHAGRKGLELGVVKQAVELFAAHGVDAESLVVKLGPAICGGCYEVDQVLWESWAVTLPEALSRTSWGTVSLDLRLAARIQLERLGVRNLLTDGGCTMEDTKLHSYRRSSDCGRQVGFVFAN